jgi:hypothetical protein
VKVAFYTRSSHSLWRAVSRADLVHLQNLFPDMVLMARLAGKHLLINAINHTQDDGGLHQHLNRACLHLAQRQFSISDYVQISWEHSPEPWMRIQVMYSICELSPLISMPLEEHFG